MSGRGGNSFKLIKGEVQRLGLGTEHFAARVSRRGAGAGRDPLKQREAKRRWYQNNREVYRARNARRRGERLDLLKRLKDRPCLDCGVRYPYYVMDFDHREGEQKNYNLSAAASSTMGEKAFMAEVEKCDVVCANCHRIRTARRGGWIVN
ncbi:hypothetical protein GCM10010168_47650 [Actinoplanes ianthinogenes]|uniref:HNH endonuclease n=1 Tax=Actinoplanes ianthinogenes TaxID=122358 RepID=A0ABM7LNW6_9ACTN|nr:hypothetical protein Aiant_15920 [Actinoplanes ianthinogenes]GGR24106.1 hypothetical protein GCM10010168_47650 [Actinoplanes ianthinogenes]